MSDEKIEETAGHRLIIILLRKILVKAWCFVRGHDFTTTTLRNHDQGGRSYFGIHECHRCGYTKDWQYDR